MSALIVSASGWFSHNFPMVRTDREEGVGGREGGKCVRRERERHTHTGGQRERQTDPDTYTEDAEDAAFEDRALADDRMAENPRNPSLRTFAPTGVQVDQACTPVSILS